MGGCQAGAGGFQAGGGFGGAQFCGGGCHEGGGGGCHHCAAASGAASAYGPATGAANAGPTARRASSKVNDLKAMLITLCSCMRRCLFKWLQVCKSCDVVAERREDDLGPSRMTFPIQRPVHGPYMHPVSSLLRAMRNHNWSFQSDFATNALQPRCPCSFEHDLDRPPTISK